jgi:hypothetical protein
VNSATGARFYTVNTQPERASYAPYVAVGVVNPRESRARLLDPRKKETLTPWSHSAASSRDLEHAGTAPPIEPTRQGASAGEGSH